jgi:hypothetical protein
MAAKQHSTAKSLRATCLSCGVHLDGGPLWSIAMSGSSNIPNILWTWSHQDLSPSKIHHFLLRKHLETAYSTILFGILLDPHETIRHQLNRSFWMLQKRCKCAVVCTAIPFYTILYHSNYTILYHCIPFYIILYQSLSIHLCPYYLDNVIHDIWLISW